MHGLVEETLCGVGECDEMTIDSIHAIAALCVGIVLIALPWLLPRDSGEYVRCTQCLKYHQACSHICPACLTPDSTASSAPQYAYILTTRTRGMHIQLLLAVGEFLICVAQCALPCLIIKNIIVNAGLPTFGTFQRMPRGGYAIDPMNGAIETSHESSGFSIAGILEIAQTLFDDCLR